MLKRASSSRVFPSKSLSRTSSEKKICPIRLTSRCFAGQSWHARRRGCDGT